MLSQMFNLLRNCQAGFQSSYVSFRILISSSRQHLLSVFLIVAFPVGVNWYFIVVLMDSLLVRLNQLGSCLDGTVETLDTPLRTLDLGSD